MLAYVDPGTGALILQIITASCAGSLFFTKRIILKLKKLISKRKKNNPNESSKES